MNLAIDLFGPLLLVRAVLYYFGRGVLLSEKCKKSKYSQQYQRSMTLPYTLAGIIMILHDIWNPKPPETPMWLFATSLLLSTGVVLLWMILVERKYRKLSNDFAV